MRLLRLGDLFRVPTPTPHPLWQNHTKTLVFKNILLLFLATCPKKELQHSLLVRRQLSGEKAGVGRFGVWIKNRHRNFNKINEAELFQLRADGIGAGQAAWWKLTGWELGHKQKCQSLGVLFTGQCLNCFLGFQGSRGEWNINCLLPKAGCEIALRRKNKARKSYFYLETIKHVSKL